VGVACPMGGVVTAICMPLFISMYRPRWLRTSERSLNSWPRYRVSIRVPSQARGVPAMTPQPH